MKNILFITLMCFGSIAAKAQIPQPDPDTTAKHFLIVASIGNLQEASAGRLAAQMAKKPEVRSFGQMMVKDHGMSEQELLALAKRRHINLPAAATGGIQPDPMLKNAGANFWSRAAFAKPGVKFLKGLGVGVLGAVVNFGIEQGVNGMEDDDFANVVKQNQKISGENNSAAQGINVVAQRT